MGDKIYMTEDNLWAVAADTNFTAKELQELLERDPEARWVIKVSGIQLETGHGALTNLTDYTKD